MYLDPDESKIDRARKHLDANRPDINFYGEESLRAAVRRLLKSYFDLVITKPFSGGDGYRYLILLQRVPAEQYGQLVVLTSKPNKHNEHKHKQVIVHTSVPLEHNLDVIVNSLLPRNGITT